MQQLPTNPIVAPGAPAANTPAQLELLRPLIPADQVGMCPRNAVPSFNRQLGEDERKEARAKVSAWALLLGQYGDLTKTCALTPSRTLRSKFLQPMPDTHLVAIMAQHLFYDEEYYRKLLCLWVPIRRCTVATLERFVLRVWMGEFRLRLDRDFLYTFDVSEVVFCLPRRCLDGVLIPEALAELARRYELWQIRLSPDQTFAMMDDFAYNPEFRSMINRVMLMARFVAYYLVNQCTKNRVKELLGIMLRVQHQVIQAQRDQRMQNPLSDVERTAFDDIVAVLSADTIDATRLSRYTHPADDPALLKAASTVEAMEASTNIIRTPLSSRDQPPPNDQAASPIEIDLNDMC